MSGVKSNIQSLPVGEMWDVSVSKLERGGRRSWPSVTDITVLQAGQRTGEEVQWQARGLHRPEEDPAQAHQEGQQAEAEETQVPHSDGRAQRYPGRPRLPSRDCRKEDKN